MKKLQKATVLLITLALLCVLPLSGNAAGRVSFDGDAEKFIFEPGSEHSPTDLFSDFKGVMPGDSITQKVYVKNDVTNNVKIKLYMRSLGAHENSAEFLSRLGLRVTQEGDSPLFDAPADQSAQLTEWVYLGTFYSGAEIDLNVTLDVPLELGDDYQDAIGYLDWQFKVDSLPISADDPKPPQTGDTTGLSLYVLLACVSGSVLILLPFMVGRRKNKED